MSDVCSIDEHGSIGEHCPSFRACIFSGAYLCASVAKARERCSGGSNHNEVSISRFARQGLSVFCAQKLLLVIVAPNKDALCLFLKPPLNPIADLGLDGTLKRICTWNMYS